MADPPRLVLLFAEEPEHYVNNSSSSSSSSSSINVKKCQMYNEGEIASTVFCAA